MNDLAGLNILITRSEPHATILAEMIHAEGGCTVIFPTVAFAPPEHPAFVVEQIKQLAQQDWLVFISPQAVAASMPFINPEKLKIKIAAVGKGTAQLLNKYGFRDVFFPQTNFSVAALLASALFQSIQSQKIAIIRGEGTHAELAKNLETRGAVVMEIIMYQRVLPNISENQIQHLLQLLQDKKINVSICTSYTGVAHLKKLVGVNAWPNLQNVPMVVMSERIKQLADELGFKTIWVAREASNKGLVEAIQHHLL